jgi:hypothetical protein
MGRVRLPRVGLRQMSARQPPEDPTRRLPRARPVATERTVAPAAPEETLWVEVLDRLSSLRTGLAFVAVLALAAIGVALWALLDDDGDADRADASRVRVERLADRVDRLENQVGDAASVGGVAALRDGQRALDGRVQALEAALEESPAAAQDVEEIAVSVEAVQDSVEALEQRLDALEAQQP